MNERLRCLFQPSTSLIAVMILWSFTVAAAPRTSPDDSEKYRIAQAYERTGDLRNAARLYQELYASQSSNDTYFGGVVRSLTGLGQFAALIPIVEKHADRTGSPTHTLLAGTLHARLNELSKARTYWDRARSLANNDESLLVQLGRDQMELFLHAEALASFLAAREKNGEATAYSDEIFRLRSASGDLNGAVADVLTAYAGDADAITAERRLSTLLSFENGPTVIAEALSELPRDDVRNLRLTAWFYRETKRWGDAFEIIALLDTRSSTPGSELLSFADGARASDQYDVALQAYDEVARRAKGANLVMTAAFGSVRTLELRLRVSASVPKVEAREIIRRYDEIIDRYGSNPLVADALYFSALLHDDVLREMEPARERLTRLVNTWRSLSRSVDGALKLADIYLAMGQDERALELLGTVVNGPTGLVADRADMARLRRADILAWNGDLDSAKVLYQPLAEASGSIASNDALDRMMLLNLAIDDSATVRAIVRADGFITRRRHLDAIRELDSIIPKIKDNDLRDRSLLMCARSCLFIADSARAAALLDKIINGNPDSIYGDRALWLYADITVSQNDSQRAIQLLEALLRNYPRSIIVPEARERIRRLRGDGR